MNDKHKSKEQLIEELALLRQRLAALEGLDAAAGRDEQTLRASEERYRTLFESAPVIIYTLSEDGRFTALNPAFEEVTGWSRSEFLGRSFAELVYSDDAAFAAQQFQRVLQRRAGESSYSEMRIVSKDGAALTIEIIGIQQIADGKVIGVSGFAHDITERKRAEEALRESKSSLQGILRSTADGILAVGSENKVLLANERFVEMWRIPPAVMASEDDSVLLQYVLDQLSDPQSFLEKVQELYKSDEESFDTLSFKDGRVFERLSRPLMHGTELRGRVWSFRDIAERKQAEEEIHRRLNELAMLHESGLALSGLLEPRAIGQKIIDVMAQKLEWHHATIRLYYPESESLELLAFSQPGIEDEAGRRALEERFNVLIARPGQGLSGWVAQHGKAVRCGDVSKDKRYVDTYHGIRSGLYVPLQVGERTIGSISVESEQADAFSESDERLLTTLATQAAIALENARLFGEIRQRVAELEAVNRVSVALRAAQSLDEMLPPLLDETLAAIHTDTGSIELYDQGENVLRTAVQRGWFEQIPLIVTDVGKGIGGAVFVQGAPHISPEFVRDPLVLESARQYLLPGWGGACVPIRTAERTVGVLYVAVPLPRQITPDEARLLETIAEMAGNAIARMKAHEQAVRRAEQLAGVNVLGRTLAEMLDLSQVYERFYQAVVQLLPDIAAVFVSLCDARKELLTGVYAVQEGEPVNVADLPPIPLTPPGQGAQSQVIHSGQPLIVDDLQANFDQAKVSVIVGATKKITRSALYVPLITRRKVIGVVQLQSYTPARFKPEDAELLSIMANTAAVAIENARLFAETERRLNQVQSLRTVDAAISSSVDLRVTLSILMDQVITQLGVDAACILMLKQHIHMLEFEVGRGFRTKAIERTYLRLGEGFAGRAALERRTIQASVSNGDGSARADLLEKEGFHTHYVTPLVAKGEVLGVLEVYHRSPFTSDDDWINFLEALADQAAIAIDSIRLFDSLQHSNVELGLAYDATIEGWSRALELRDEETEGHTRRVTDLTMQLARLMGMSGPELVHVQRGALLHDIGKMGVPDSILLKPGPLTDEEWEIMHRHPTNAYELLLPVVYLRRALDIPYCHHEKWDGTGYPRGLMSEQIPLAARIFAIADVWDALRSDRPYRPAWSEKQALEYIREQAGKHFDPRVVETFSKLSENGE